MREAVGSSETSAKAYQTSLCHNLDIWPQDRNSNLGFVRKGVEGGGKGRKINKRKL
jgi:hypothetical protein